MKSKQPKKAILINTKQILGVFVVSLIITLFPFVFHLSKYQDGYPFKYTGTRPTGKMETTTWLVRGRPVEVPEMENFFDLNIFLADILVYFILFSALLTSYKLIFTKVKTSTHVAFF